MLRRSRHVARNQGCKRLHFSELEVAGRAVRTSSAERAEEVAGTGSFAAAFFGAFTGWRHPRTFRVTGGTYCSDAAMTVCVGGVGLRDKH